MSVGANLHYGADLTDAITSNGPTEATSGRLHGQVVVGVVVVVVVVVVIIIIIASADFLTFAHYNVCRP